MVGELVKKLVVREIAELVHAVKAEMTHIDKSKDNPGDESVTSIVTEIGSRDDLLDGEIIARGFGFTSDNRRT
jgi:hypothetical protein